MVHCVLEEIAVESGNRSTKLTYADYLALPDDGLRHEIIDGDPTRLSRSDVLTTPLLPGLELSLDRVFA